jgi:hypothetical protein
MYGFKHAFNLFLIEQNVKKKSQVHGLAFRRSLISFIQWLLV